MRFYIQKLMDKFGSWFTALGFLGKYNIKEGDVVIDVGAYYGYFVIKAARKVGPSGKVIAYEPDPLSCQVMRDYVAKAGLKNVEIIEKGLYKENTTLKMDCHYTYSKIVEDGDKPKHVKDIACTTLDDKVKRLGLTKIDFIKMDIEGAELEFMAGAQEALKITKNLAIACYHIRDGKMTRDIMEPQLQAMGYKTSIGFPLHLTLYASK
ncbi:FkbM family methyltransferase [Patescibacteria group bacterium]|nr:FkbM family methyltransferase [Patescibacteria group bacterium]MBU1890989.1 FkbM family methyltransferase [Patescibacteria group bacterium]